MHFHELDYLLVRLSQNSWKELRGDLNNAEDWYGVQSLPPIMGVMLTMRSDPAVHSFRWKLQWGQHGFYVNPFNAEGRDRNWGVFVVTTGFEKMEKDFISCQKKVNIVTCLPGLWQCSADNSLGCKCISTGSRFTLFQNGFFV